jgi:tetratricopeptide (TPR) repeat protein
MDLANAYVADLEDYPRAIAALDTLDKRYPQHEFGSQALYLRYLIAMRQSKFDKAQEYSLRLLQLYPNSQYAVLVRPKEDNTQSNAEVPVAQYFETTYQLLGQHQYTEVLMRVKESKKLYGDPVYESRFRLVEAIALASSGNGKRADTLLKEFTKINNNDSLKGWADAIVKLLGKYPDGFPAVPVTINSSSHWPYYDDGRHHGPVYDTDANGVVTIHQGDTSAVASSIRKYMPYENVRNNLPAVITYQYKPDQEHYFMLVGPGLDARLVSTRAAIKEFNKGKGLDSMAVLIDIFNAQKTALLVGKFRNADEARSYLAALREDKQVLSAYKPEEVQLMVMTQDNYKILLFDHNFGAYTDFYEANYK